MTLKIIALRTNMTISCITSASNMEFSCQLFTKNIYPIWVDNTDILVL